MTTEHEASRRLVKSPPELWAECSEAGSLARHLSDSFGEIRITRLAPETAVAWEGEHASGTVRIEPSGWGTRVTLTAEVKANAVGLNGQAQEEVEVVDAEPDVTEDEADVVDEVDAIDEADVVEEADLVDERPDLIPEAQPDPLVAQTPEPGPPPVDDLEPEPRRWLGLMARMRGFFRRDGGEVDAEGTVVPEPVIHQPEAVAPDPEATAHQPETVPPDPESMHPEPEVVVPPDEAPAAVADAEPPSEQLPTINADAVLTAALDSLGQAHHRPFSRA